MSGKTFLKTTALVALAAAGMAAPSIASAQEQDRGEHRGWGRDGGGGMMQARPERVERQQQVQPQQQPQFQAQRQQQFEAQRQQMDAQRQQWQAQRQQQVQAQQQAQAQARIDGQRGGWQGRYQGQAAQQPGGNWQGRYQGQAQQTAPVYRNNGYVDAERNRSYTERRDHDRDGDRNRWQNRGQYQGQYNNQYRGQYYGGRQQAWNNDWRRDRRYDWRGYRNEHREVFRAGRYYAPFSGYYYRPLSIGFYLDQAFFGQDYWIGDPEFYRLPPAYGPYRWVRYYDDVLLVNIYNGEVVDVIQGFFY